MTGKPAAAASTPSPSNNGHNPETSPPTEIDPARAKQALIAATATAGQLEQQVNFWKQKYFEQLIHSTQVIQALSPPAVSAGQQMALLAQQVQQAQEAAEGRPPTAADPAT